MNDRDTIFHCHTCQHANLISCSLSEQQVRCREQIDHKQSFLVNLCQNSALFQTFRIFQSMSSILCVRHFSSARLNQAHCFVNHMTKTTLMADVIDETTTRAKQMSHVLKTDETCFGSSSSTSILAIMWHDQNVGTRQIRSQSECCLSTLLSLSIVCCCVVEHDCLTQTVSSLKLLTELHQGERRCDDALITVFVTLNKHGGNMPSKFY